MRHAFALFLAAGTSFAAFPAFALDGTAFAERLKAVYSLQGGGDIAYASAEVAGENITIKGVTFSVPPAAPYPLGDILFEGVVEGDAGWDIGRVSIADVSTTSEQSTFVMKGFEIENLSLPSSDTEVTPFLVYERAAVDEMSVAIGGKPAFGITGYEVTIDAPEPNVRVNFESSADNLYVNVADMTTDPKGLSDVKTLGLERIEGVMVMNGSWVGEKGTLTVDEFSLDVPNAGRFDMTFAIDGYTPAFMKTLQEVSKASAAAGADEQAQAAQGLAMLGLLQQLSYVSTSIRYDDAGLTPKVLQLLATQQNLTPEALITQYKAVLPFALAQVQNPEFAANVTTEVGKFLDNPKSLEIDATPAEPVAGTMLMATGAGNPVELLKTLNVVVKGNQE
ncbi:MAG: hypothetical protein ACRCT6_04300 [Notoacmeibacter sp.]